MMRVLLAVSLLAMLATGASAQGMSSEDFESGSAGAWDWPFGAGGFVESDGSNNYFRNDNIINFAPILKTVENAPGWTGDFIAAQVTRVAADFRAFGGPSYITHYPMSVMFRNTMGTPNVEDDIYVYTDPYFWGDTAPDFTEGWQTTSFDVPWDFVGVGTETPEGWIGGSYYTDSMGLPEGTTWQDVMSSVDKIEWWWFHPAEFGTLQTFDVAADNMLIEWTGGAVRTYESSVGQMKSNFNK